MLVAVAVPMTGSGGEKLYCTWATSSHTHTTVTSPRCPSSSLTWARWLRRCISGRGALPASMLGPSNCELGPPHGHFSVLPIPGCNLGYSFYPFGSCAPTVARVAEGGSSGGTVDTIFRYLVLVQLPTSWKLHPCCSQGAGGWGLGEAAAVQA